jgi:hypothetical protein
MMRFAWLPAILWLALASAVAEAHPPRGIAVTAEGRVFFGDLERIWSIGPDGRMAVVRSSAGGQTHELFLDEGDHLFGEDSFYDPATRRYRSALWMRAPDGRYSITYGPTERPAWGAGVFKDRLGCSVSAQESRARALLLHRLCPGGEPQLLSDPAAMKQAGPLKLLSNIGGAAFGPDGSFYFRHRGIVQRLRAGDRLVTAATGFAPEDFGIAVDEAGALYVAEHGRRRIVRVQPNGRRSVPITAEAPWAPTGVAARGGALYALEVTDHQPGRPSRYRVRRLGRDGAVALLGTVPPAG